MAELQLPELKTCLNYIILGFVVIFVGVILFTFADNPDALSSKTYTYMLTLIIPLVIVGAYLMQQSTGGNAKTTAIRLAAISGVSVFLYVIFYLYSQMDSSYYPIINFILNIIVGLSILVALSIFYKIFINNMSRAEGVGGFIINLIFYIPCMLSDFLEYLLQQYKLTPNIVFIMFVIEIILVLLYLYLPKLLNKALKPSTLVLQNEPVFLDVDNITLITADKLNPVDKTQLIQNSMVNSSKQNYCLTMWIFMNPQNKSNAAYVAGKDSQNGDSNKESEIFNYSHTDSKGIVYPKPRITYSYDSITSKDYYHLYFTNVLPNAETSQYKYDITVSGQKWNQFVFNYNNNKVDVFINGNLERSFDLATNIPQYSLTDDIITIGSKNGLDGAICNITYSKNPLTKYQIANSYNLLMNANPPINPKA